MATIAAAITTVAATTAAAADQSRTESGRGGKNLHALSSIFLVKKFWRKGEDAAQNLLQSPQNWCIILVTSKTDGSPREKERGPAGFVVCSERTDT